MAAALPAGVAGQQESVQTAPRTLVLSLSDALRIAAGESETVWVAEAGVMRAVGNERSARSGFFPQVSGSADYTRTLRSQFSGINFGGAGGTGGTDGIGTICRSGGRTSTRSG